MGHLIMLCIGFSRLGMVQNYKPKCQKATDHELREVVELVQEQDYSIRKAAAEKNVAFESLLNLLGEKKTHKEK